MRTIGNAAAVVVLLALAWALPTGGVELDPGNETPMTVDHGAWDKILAKYVIASPDGVNRFVYGRVTAADKKALKSYLHILQGVSAGALGGDESRAYWINFYNALTIDVVLDHYPVKSIRDIAISPGLFSVGPWKKALVSVEGKQLSLDNIEHDILRKTWRDPRVHYAVNCASISCPNLMATAFTAKALDEMLDKGARDYVNHPRGVTVREDRVRLSSIYDWYRRDFGESDAEVLAHVSKYAAPPLKKQLAAIDRIDGYDYDWSLNEAK